MIDTMKANHDGQGNFESRSYKIERLFDAEAKPSHEYLKLTQSVKGDYSVGVFNSITGTSYYTTFHDNYAAAYYTFKTKAIERNGGNDLYKSQYGETREERQQALGLYFDRLCYNGRSITEFEDFYVGSYPSRLQFIHNGLLSAFTASDFPSLKVRYTDLDFKKIEDRWFDEVSGDLTDIAIERASGIVYHIYQIPKNRAIDLGKSQKESSKLFDILGT
jgi:hypothetical protein